MGIYQGIWKIKNQNIPIKIEGMHSLGSIRRENNKSNPCGLVISINQESDLEERVKTLIHEAWHISHPFLYDFPQGYKKWNDDGTFTPEHIKIENEIEQLTEEVYKNQPVLVDYLKFELSKNRYIKTLGRLGEFLPIKKQVLFIRREEREKAKAKKKREELEEKRQLRFNFV